MPDREVGKIRVASSGISRIANVVHSQVSPWGSVYDCRTGGHQQEAGPRYSWGLVIPVCN